MVVDSLPGADRVPRSLGVNDDAGNHLGCDVAVGVVVYVGEQRASSRQCAMAELRRANWDGR